MLGENIKTYRQKKGYTQEEVANRLHVTRQTISKWEKNYSVPDAEVFVKLADVLEVQTSQLLALFGWKIYIFQHLHRSSNIIRIVIC